MRSKIRILICLVSIAALTFPFSGCSSMKRLKGIVDFVVEVEEGRPARVLQLTDIQIIDSSQDNGELSAEQKQRYAKGNMDDLAWKYVTQAVESVEPDLIVLTGDNVYGRYDDAGTSWKALIECMDSFKTPWALIYGNHDNESRKGVVWQNERLSESEYCLFSKGTVSGNGNYTVALTQGGKLIKTLFMFDSHGCEYTDPDNGVTPTAGILESQLEWCKATQESLKKFNGGKNAESVGFTHHPLSALFDGAKQYGWTRGISDWKVPLPNDNGDFGEINDSIGTSNRIDADLSLFNTMRDYGTQGWFFGHYHVNNASITHQGVRLTFGLKSSEYDEFNPALLGGTKIILDKGVFEVSHVYHNPDGEGQTA